MGAGTFIAKTGVRLLGTYVVVLMTYFIVVRVLPVVAAGGNMAADPLLAALRRTAEDPRFSLWIGETIKRFGLDRPLVPDQLLMYLRNVLVFDFGISVYTQKPVLDEIAIRLPYTLSFYTITTIVPIVIGFYLGITAAKNRGRPLDTAIVQASIFSNMLPGWLTLLIVYYVLAYLPRVTWGYYIFPLPVRPPEIGIRDWEQFRYLLWYMSPMLLAALIAWSGGWIYYIRQLVVSEMGQDYVTTALAKGLDERSALRKHVIPNVRPPIVISLAYAIPGIFGGAIIFEIISNWPGVAYFAYQALLNWDFPVMSAFFTISAALTVTSLFIAEVVLVAIDPRVRTGG
ncbi:MAG: ABC transporter permease [Sulfolobales archaeon]